MVSHLEKVRNNCEFWESEVAIIVSGYNGIQANSTGPYNMYATDYSSHESEYVHVAM